MNIDLFFPVRLERVAVVLSVVVGCCRLTERLTLRSARRHRSGNEDALTKETCVCVVGPDMSRLSIERDICLGECLWDKISTVTVAVTQCQGSLCSSVCVGIRVVMSTHM